MRKLWVIIIQLFVASLLAQPPSKKSLFNDRLMPPSLHVFNSGKELSELFCYIDSALMGDEQRTKIVIQMLSLQEKEQSEVVQLLVDTTDRLNHFRLIYKATTEPITSQNKKLQHIDRIEKKIDRSVATVLYRLIQVAVLDSKYPSEMQRTVSSNLYFFLFRDPHFGNELIGMSRQNKEQGGLPLLMQDIKDWICGESNQFPSDLIQKMEWLRKEISGRKEK